MLGPFLRLLPRSQSLSVFYLSKINRETPGLLRHGAARLLSSPPSPMETSPAETPPVEPLDTRPKTSRQKLKEAIRDYGSTVLVFHIASGVTLLSMWYLVVSSGVDVSALIKTFGLEGTVGSFAGGASTFVVAYAIHKATAPLRIGLTLTTAPLIVNFLRKKGLMKIKQ